MSLIQVVKRATMPATVSKHLKSPTAFCIHSLPFTEQTSWFNLNSHTGDSCNHMQFSVQ